MNVYRKRLARTACGLLVVTATWCLAACKPERQPATGEQLVLDVPGSGTCEMILGHLARTFQERQPGIKVVVPPSIGSTGGILAVGEGKAAVARVGRRPSAGESQYNLEYHEFARDALVFAVGKEVTGVPSLTLARLSDIYAGKITNWSEVGGPDAPINLILREKTESTRQELAKTIAGLDKQSDPAQAKIVYRDFEVLDLLEKFPTAIGFSTLSNLKSGSGRWTVLQLDGVAPDAESLASGSYPFSLEMGLVFPARECSPVARQFLEFVKSPEGAAVIRANGLLTPGDGS